MRKKEPNLIQAQTPLTQFQGLKTIEALPYIIENLQGQKPIKTNKKIEYYNIPCAFDIETSSFYEDGEKRAIMYEWTLGVNDIVIYGRTWEEFINVINEISLKLSLSTEKRLIIFVHNLAYEFQFIRRWFSWENVFSLDERKPVYALTDIGIEFRCSYILSGYGLATIGKNLKRYHCEKLVGDLDYSKLRHSRTPLTEQELKYCENDVRVVMCYIRECIERDGDITRLQLTKTGYVRKYCRDACTKDANNKNRKIFAYLDNRKLMDELTLDPEEYIQARRAFSGGFTHANAYYSGKILNNVGSVDFSSAYPAVICSEMFPMSKGRLLDCTDFSEKDISKYCTLYCCIFDVEFRDLEAKFIYENPISLSHCIKIEGYTENNGRIVEAKLLQTTITNVDFNLFKRFYKWSGIAVRNFRIYRKGYLPKKFIQAVLKLYADKTKLKGVEGKEEEYQNSKEMLNSCYGMMVTDIVRPEITVDPSGEWGVNLPNLEDSIKKYNEDKKRFISYLWGIFVTAYNRYNLASGQLEFAEDYIYSDTDSIKAVNMDKHLDYINRYNKLITYKVNTVLDHYGIDRELAAPLTIKGKVKQLGVWDMEAPYKRFKTLGAKRYAIEQEGALVLNRDTEGEKIYNYSITVSGVSKSAAVPYMLDKYGEAGFFEAFEDGLEIPAEHTGKNTHTYIDDAAAGFVVDYLGNKSRYYERSFVHLEPAEYTLGLASAYVNYLKGIREEWK